METSMPKVRNLFDSPIVYVIPDYQRTYVWNEEDQWEPLWLDVVNLVSLLADSHNDSPPLVKPHFLGAAVLKEMSLNNVEGAKKFAVVDGQQRLTTIQLLLTAVADVFREIGELSSLEGSVRNLTINWVAGKPYEEEPDKFRPLAGDYQSFTRVLTASREGEQLLGATDPVGKCYHFFKGKVSQWLGSAEDSGQTIEGRAKALLAAISDHLQIVVIYLNRDENQSAIFEALNARGEPLSEYEKVKNYILFKESEIRQVDQGYWYDRYLREFDDRKWMSEVGRGAARRRVSDLFLDHWLRSKLGRVINARRVYREFRSEVEKPGINTDLESWCMELKRDGQYFWDWENTDKWDGHVETLFHSRRRAIGIGAVWPFLLALSRADTSPDDENRCFRAIDSFLWRRAIVGLDARNYGDVALELLEALSQRQAGDLPYSDAVIRHLVNYQNERSSWPDDDAVRRAILTRNLPGRQPRIILEAIERGMMRGKRPGNENLSGNLPIEHLMPQTRNLENWPLNVSDDSEVEAAEAVRRDLIHRLGNLTLVQPGLNSVLSNRAWVEKRRIINEQDNLYINKELLNHAPVDYWDEDQIRLRCERLADHIVQIWPHGFAVTGEIERIHT